MSDHPRAEIGWTERHRIGRSIVTWDDEAKVGYAYADMEPEDVQVARTIEVEDRLMIDVDSDGRVLGVEVLGRRVGVADLLAVLGKCSFR